MNRMKGFGFGVTSRQVAVRRLSHIIAADRAAVPCGRWVKVIRLPKTQGGMMMRLVDEAMWRRASTFIDSITKPRYRYEVRK